MPHYLLDLMISEHFRIPHVFRVMIYIYGFLCFWQEGNEDPLGVLGTFHTLEALFTEKLSQPGVFSVRKPLTVIEISFKKCRHSAFCFSVWFGTCALQTVNSTAQASTCTLQDGLAPPTVFSPGAVRRWLPSHPHTGNLSLTMWSPFPFQQTGRWVINFPAISIVCST